MGQLASGAFDGSGTGVFPGGAGFRPIVLSYDFAVQGGAVSSIILGAIPAGNSVLWAEVELITALTSGGAATAGLTLEAAGDIKAVATLISASPWIAPLNARYALAPILATPTTRVTTTVDRNVLLVVGAFALTAGKFFLHLYVQGAK